MTNNEITNTAPDIPVTITGNGATTISGTYPEFTISSTDNVDDADNDPTNEVQQLSINGNTLSISNGNSVEIPSSEGGITYTQGNGIDLTNNQITNTAPDIPVTITGDGATSISGTYPSFTISSTDNVEDDDSDPENEIQDLSLNGSVLSLSNSTQTVTLPTGTTYTPGTGIEIVNDQINNLAPDIPVTITGDGATTISGTYPAFTVSSKDSISPPQELTVLDDTLFISDGNKVTLPKSSLWKENGTKIYYDVDNIGIGVDTPMTAIHLAKEKNVLFGESLTGSGFKMIYYGQKGAFRVGYLNNPFGGYNYNKFWDYDSVGYYSFAAGQNARAKGFGAFAFGSFGWADGSGSVAFFGNARGNNSFTFGGSSKGRGSITFEGVADEEGGIAMYGYTGGRYGVSIGGGTTGLGASSSREDYAIAIGWNSDARGQASIALGPSDAYGYNSFSTGWVTEARGNYSSTFGYQTNSYAYASMALGRFNVITGDSASWNGNDPIFMIGDGTSNANRSNSFTILKNGKTAVGYDNPTGRLQVRPISSLNDGGNLNVANSTLLLGTTTAGMAFDANQIETIGSALYFNFNSTQEVRIAEGGGNVGIGLNPGARLDVKQSSDANAGGLRIRSAANNNNYWDQYFNGTSTDLTFAYRNANRAAIDAATGAYNVLSDRRMKTNIQALDPVLDKVMKLEASRYDYKDALVKDQSSIGFIAQDVEAIFPEMVAPLGDYKSLSYAEFSVVAIKAIQEQQGQIDELKNEVQELKKLLLLQIESANSEDE